jgi:hypothetical protein
MARSAAKIGGAGTVMAEGGRGEKYEGYPTISKGKGAPHLLGHPSRPSCRVELPRCALAPLARATKHTVLLSLRPMLCRGCVELQRASARVVAAAPTVRGGGVGEGPASSPPRPAAARLPSWAPTNRSWPHSHMRILWEMSRLHADPAHVGADKRGHHGCGCRQHESGHARH